MKRDRNGRFIKGNVMPDSICKKISNTLKGSIPWIKGKKHSLKTRKKMRESHKRGEKHPNWKGSSVGYGGLHVWVRKNYKKPKKCENCGNEKKLDWANKSGHYLRTLADWLALCRKCHSQLDKGNPKRPENIFKKI